LAHGAGGRTGTERQAELLVLDAGRHRVVGVRIDTWRDADEHPLTRPGQSSDPGDLPGRVDHDPPDAVGYGGPQVGRGFRVAVQHDSLGGKADRARHRQFAF
jgi:hypothetical protein